MRKSRSKPALFFRKPSEDVPIVTSHAGDHWFESSSLHQKGPDFARDQDLFFCSPRNSWPLLRAFPTDPSRDPYGEKNREEQTAPGRKNPARCFFFTSFIGVFARSLRRNLGLIFIISHIAWLMTLPMVSAASRFMSAVAWVQVLRVKPAE